MEQFNTLIRQALCLPIKLYQYFLSPFMRPSCRFYPSCSEYALTALSGCGIIQGLWLICKRIIRCHPWSSGGYDPVFPNDEKL